MIPDTADGIWRKEAVSLDNPDRENPKWQRGDCDGAVLDVVRGGLQSGYPGQDENPKSSNISNLLSIYLENFASAYTASWRNWTGPTSSKEQ